MNNGQLFDNIMHNDMTSRHNDAVLVDKFTRAIPKQTEYEKACSLFASVPHELPSAELGGMRFTAHGSAIAVERIPQIAENLFNLTLPTGDAMVALKQSDEWHSEAPPVAGVYSVRFPEESGRPAWVPGGKDAFAHFDGNQWSGWSSKVIPVLGWDAPVFKIGQWQWLHLVEADAKPDAQGWVTWDPKPDSVCPVPDMVRFSYRRRDQIEVEATSNASRYLGMWRHEMGELDIIAYRILGAE